MLNRRHFVNTSLAAGALGLIPTTGALATAGTAAKDALIPDYDLPASRMPRIVTINAGYAPWEVHVDPNKFYMYWTLPNNKAMRYTTGVGRGNLYHPGVFYIGAKKEWPTWTPTPDMISRQPELYIPYKDGMPGGIANPLGARAMYLYTEAKGDSYLRLHGTNDPRTIGGAVSNGCARLVNDQIIDLYNRTKIGTRVVLNPKNNGVQPHS